MVKRFACGMLVAFVGHTGVLAADRAAQDCAGAGDPRRIIAGCSALLARGAGPSARFRAEALVRRSRAHNAAGDVDKAIADCDEATRIDPTFALAYYGRGLIFGAKGDDDRALAEFDQAIRLDPTFAAAYDGRGYSYKRKGEIDRAIGDFNQAIRLNPNDGLALVNRGVALAEKGDRRPALADLEAALKLDPRNTRLLELRNRLRAALASGQTSSPGQAGAPAASGAQVAAGYKQLEGLYNAKKYDEVIAQAPRMLDALRARRGERNIDIVFVAELTLLALSNVNAERVAEADALVRELVAVAEPTYGAESSDFAVALAQLAIAYLNHARYAQAEPLFRRALAIYEKTLGPDHMTIARVLNEIEVICIDLGRYAEAEALARRAIAILEHAPGVDPRNISAGLHNLAALYQGQGRYAEAEPLARRALAIDEKIPLTADWVDSFSSVLNLLASLNIHLDRPAEAEALYKRALAAIAKASRPNEMTFDISTGNVLLDLAELYRKQGRLAEAGPLFARGVALWEKWLGGRGESALLARAVGNFASLYRDQGRHAEAGRLYARALAMSEKLVGMESPDAAGILANIAVLRLAGGQVTEALVAARRSAAIAVKMLSEPIGAGVEAASLHRYFDIDLEILDAAARDKLAGDKAADEAFAAAQWANQSAAAAAVNQMAARFGAGNDALARLVREQQDAAGEYRGLDKGLVAELAKPAAQRDAAGEANLRRRMAEVDQRLRQLHERLAAEFPDYTGLSSPKSLEAAEARNLLGPDEALLLWFTGDRASYVFAATREDLLWRAIPLGAKTLSARVAAFRRGLEVGAVNRGLARIECNEAEASKRGLSRAECGEAIARDCTQSSPDARGLARLDCIQAMAHVECSEEEAAHRGLSRLQCGDAIARDCAQADPTDRGLGRVECDSILAGRRDLFDLAGAHDLYTMLFAPVEELIKNKHHLLVVPSGALTALPFHLLVTRKPPVAMPPAGDRITTETFAPYREAAWLLKRHAVTVLPSVASLKALRMLARKDPAAKPMVGFGDPVFDQDELKAPAGQRAAGRTVAQTRGYTEFWEGAGGDRAKLSGLPRLVDTAVELNAIAKNLGAAASDIHLRADASETTVKRAPLTDYRVVYFATHGLVAGDVKGLAEPSLALTMPREPSDLDDGLLTASEVAQLKLNADWVVLSACNTIAGDKPGAEALSGLARAFFYAGARALLVSHWSVDSDAATRLTTSTFGIIKSDASLGRAEALRRAMLAYLNDTTNPQNAYPAFWGPFSVIGDGAAR